MPSLPPEMIHPVHLSTCTHRTAVESLSVAMHVEVLTSKILRVWSREQDTSLLPPLQSVIICTGPWWPPCAWLSTDRGLSDMESVLLCRHTLIVLSDEHEKRRLLASSPTGGGTAEAAASPGVSSRLVFSL